MIRSFKHLLATLAFFLLLPLTSAGAQSSSTSCSTSYDYNVESSFVVPGPFLTCFFTSGTVTKTETCTTTTYEEICNVEVEYLVFILPHGGFAIAIIHTTTYETVETGSTTTTNVSTCPFNNVVYGPGFLPFSFVSSSHSVSMSDTDKFRHDVPDAVSATFEGTPLAQGEEIDFSDYGAGTYNYTVIRSDGTNTSTHVYTITVQATHRLEQVDQSFTRRTVPSALYEFTNTTNETVELLLEAKSTSPSVKVFLPENAAMVAPGQTIQREVLFTTTEGHGIPEGANISALVSASSLGEHLSTIEVVAASSSTTKGSGEDLRIQSELNNRGLPSMCTKTGKVGDRYSIKIDSPRGTFDGAPVTLGFDMFALERPIARMFEDVPFHLSSAYQSVALGTMTSGGVSHSTTLPASMKGLVLRAQAIVTSPLAANGRFALSDAFDVRVQ